MLPGAVVPVTVTGEPDTAELVGRARHRERRRRPACARRSARYVTGRQHDVAPGGEVGGEPHERRRRPGERRGRARRAAVREADRGDRRVGAERRGREVGQLPVLLGDEADAGGELAHAVEQRRRAGRVAGRERLLGALGRERRPEVAGALAARRPRAGRRSRRRRSRRRCSGASPARSACSTRSSRRRRAATRATSGSFARQLAEPHELEEAGVDHRALVERRAAVADVVGDRGVRVAGLREADEVRAARAARSSSPSSP